MSQDELVDVVDAGGNFIEVVLKREAHEKGLLHKTVISQIIDSTGRWILAIPSKGRQDAGQYVSPMGGHVSAGETEADALKRELFEEWGLQGDFKYELVGQGIFDRHVIGRHENHIFILYKSYSDQELTMSHETESYKYFTEEEIKKELKDNPQSFGEAFHFSAKFLFPDLYIGNS